MSFCLCWTKWLHFHSYITSLLWPVVGTGGHVGRKTWKMGLPVKDTDIIIQGSHHQGSVVTTPRSWQVLHLILWSPLCMIITGWRVHLYQWFSMLAEREGHCGKLLNYLRTWAPLLTSWVKNPMVAGSRWEGGWEACYCSSAPQVILNTVGVLHHWSDRAAA